MDLGLVLNKIVHRNGGLTRCPNCGKIYDSLKNGADAGIGVCAENGDYTTFDICGHCVYHPKTIDLSRVKDAHKRRGTHKSEIEEGICQLRRLKEGKVTEAEIIG